MDGLGVAANIIAVIQLTAEIVKTLSSIKDAPEECRRATLEASNLLGLLTQLRYHVESRTANDPWYVAVRALTVENGPLDQYREALEQLQVTVKVKDGVKGSLQRLVWRFKKDEAEAILARMERLKSLINNALQLDHFKLSQAISADTSAMRTALPVIQLTVAAIQDANTQERLTKVLEWLSPSDFLKQQQDIHNRWQEGTGEWFLDASEFQTWLKTPGSTLYCPGMPGAGKTLIAANVIKHLQVVSQSNNVGLAFVYCNYKAQGQQNAAYLLSALLQQLIYQRADTADIANALYDKHVEHKSRPSVKEVVQALALVCARYEKTFIVVDALDECAAEYDSRTLLLDSLAELQTKGAVQLLYTSRDILGLRQRFTTTPRLEIRATEEDVGLFLAGLTPRLPQCIREDANFREEIFVKIIKLVDGMFLLAKLCAESLCHKLRKKEIRVALTELSSGPDALDKAYLEAVARIDGQTSESRSLAQTTISWLRYAQRPLTARELCHAVSIDPDVTELGEDDLYLVETIIDVCAGLVTVDDESQIVHFIHYTTQEYFERMLSEWIVGAQEQIAQVCLTYLSFEAFREGGCLSEQAYDKRKADNPLLEYCALYWADHVQQVEAAVSESALEFLKDDKLVDSAIQADWRGHGFYEFRQNFGKSHALRQIARHGLAHLAQLYVMGRELSPAEVDAEDERGRTPLLYAAKNGHATILKLLIDTGQVDIGRETEMRWTPFMYAAEAGHEAIVKLLTQTGRIDINVRNKDGQTPLFRAAINAHESTVKFLIQESGIEIDVLDADSRTPFSYAASSGHDVIMKLLMQTNQINIDIKDWEERTPLSHAAESGSEAAVALLLASNKVAIDSRDRWGRTPFSYAAERGHESIAKQLIETCRVNLDFQDKYGRTPLSYAAGSGHATMIKLVLDTGKVAINSSDESGLTPLFYAVSDGDSEAVSTLLLDKGAKIFVDERGAQSALRQASWRRNERLMRLLLSHDINLNVPNKNQETPLHQAVKSGNLSIARMLLKAGCLADPIPSDPNSPLFLAARMASPELIVLLIEHGADLSAMDHYGRSPLDWARTRPPLYAMLGHFIADQIPTPVEVSKARLLQTIEGLCNEISRSSQGRPPSSFYELGKCLLFFGEDEAASIAFEQCRHPQNPAWYVGYLFHCTLCRFVGDVPIVGVRYVCKSCAEVNLCKFCHSEYKTATREDMCSGHEFLAVPREAYKNLSPECVDLQGTTVQEWLAGLVESLKRKMPSGCAVMAC